VDDILHNYLSFLPFVVNKDFHNYRYFLRNFSGGDSASEIIAKISQYLKKLCKKNTVAHFLSHRVQFPLKIILVEIVHDSYAMFTKQFIHDGWKKN